MTIDTTSRTSGDGAARRATIERRTGETRIDLRLDLDGGEVARIQTGLGFLDHMLGQVATHGRIDLELEAMGDVHVDDHHTVEDCGIALGLAIDRALGERRGIERFGSAFAPLDEALARAVVDCSGRPSAVVDLGLRRERLGDVACENLDHLLRSIATSARLTVHVDVLRGENDHHRAEAAFKAFAVALRQAVRRTGDGSVPSTKGVL